MTAEPSFPPPGGPPCPRPPPAPRSGSPSACSPRRPPPPPTHVKVGDKAPAFEARNEADKTWTSSDNFGKDGKVAYKNTKVNPTDGARKVIDFVTGARR